MTNKELETEERVQTPPILTCHASRRANQRKFSQTEIAYVLEHGQLIRRSGICFYFLADKNVQMADRKLDWVQHLVGATILVSAESEAVITMYRNKNQNALRDIKRKAKYRIGR